MLLAIHYALSVFFFYTCFCRAVKTDCTNSKDILLAFWCLGIASVVCLGAPIVFDWRPDGVSLSLLASIVLVQTVTARHWRGGPPNQFKGETK